MARIPAADRRTALARAALRVIAREGVAAATTRRIVAEAGMSLASFHYVFASRDELMAELVEAVVAGEQPDFAPAPTPGAPREELRAAVRTALARSLARVRADPERERARCELTRWALREPGLEAPARLRYERSSDTAERAAAGIAERTGAEWRRPVADIARLLVALTDGVAAAWLVTRDDAAAETALECAADALAALAAPAPTSLPTTLPPTTPESTGRR